MKRIVIDYVVIEASSGQDLKLQIVAHQAAGFELQGGVSVALTTNDEGTTGAWFAQAMVLWGSTE